MGTQTPAPAIGEPISATRISPLAARLAPLLTFADAAADVVSPLLAKRRASQRWVLVKTAKDVEVYRAAKGTATKIAASLAELGTTDSARLSKAGDIELRLDRAQTVSTHLTLPADARSYVDAIMAHRLDRLTPWKPESVVYGTRVLEGSAGADTIEVEFVATSREILSEVLAPLRERAVEPTSIGVTGGALTQPVAIDLLFGSASAATVSRVGLRTALLAFLPLAFVALAASHTIRTEASAQVDEAVRQLATERARILGGGAGGGETQVARDLIEARRAIMPRFQLVAALAAAVPDHTFLTDLEIRLGTVRLRGSSLSAPSLIPVLEALPMLRDVRFEAPLVREAQGQDRFDIVGTLVPVPEG